MVKIDPNQNTEGDIVRKMFIGGLSPISNEDSLLNFFRQFGEIVDVVIMRDAATNRSRGFGFITFKDASSVDMAQAARPHVIDGKTVDSKRALTRTDTPKSATGNSGRKIFVGGLKENHDEQSLTEHFQQFGTILGVKILVDKNTGRKRGFAYVEFEDYDSADKAVLHQPHTIKYLTVDVKKSNYKEERAKKLASMQEATQNGAVQSASSCPPPGYAPAPYPTHYGYPQAAPGYGWGPAPYGGQQPAAPYPTQQPPAAYSQQPAAAYPPPPASYSQQPPAYGTAPAWNGWGYSAPPAAPPQPAANTWNSAPPSTQTFGTYEQSYNGGPQKTAKLQSNRNNPYRS